MNPIQFNGKYHLHTITETNYEQYEAFLDDPSNYICDNRFLSTNFEKSAYTALELNNFIYFDIKCSSQKRNRLGLSRLARSNSLANLSNNACDVVYKYNASWQF